MRPTKLTIASAFALALGLSAGPTYAHHSTNLYINDLKTQTIKGTFVNLKMSNPHAVIQVAVRGPNGAMQQWAIETHAPGNLIRLGWTPKTFRKGEEITVVGNPSRNGDFYMNLVEVVFADGYHLKPGSVNPPRPAS